MKRELWFRKVLTIKTLVITLLIMLIFSTGKIYAAETLVQTADNFNLYFTTDHSLSFQHPKHQYGPAELIATVTITSGTLNGTNAKLTMERDMGGTLHFLSQDTATLTPINASISVNGSQAVKSPVNIASGDTVLIAWEVGPLEPLFPIMFAFGMIGLMSLFIGPLYTINQWKKRNYYNGFVWGLAITAIGFGLLIAWLWG